MEGNAHEESARHAIPKLSAFRDVRAARREFRRHGRHDAGAIGAGKGQDVRMSHRNLVCCRALCQEKVLVHGL
jgi:hypothetical protein